MGKPDSTTMREKLEYAQNEENDVDSRVEALDDFEMVGLSCCWKPERRS